MNEDDDLPDDEDGDEPHGPFFDYEQEETYRSQTGKLGIPKICKCGNGETIVGTIINETLRELELKWPMLVSQVYTKIDGEVYPMMILSRYAPGVYAEFITLNKDQLIWWNDTDKAVDEYYLAQLPKLYKSFEDVKAKQLTDERNVYPSEKDEELENLVTKLTVGKKPTSLENMIDLMTGISKKQAPPPGSLGD